MAKEQKGELQKGGNGPHAIRAPHVFSPFEELDRWFESAFPGGWPRPLHAGWPQLQMPLEGRLPKVDIIDRESEIVVRAEIAGVDKKDLDVSVTDNTVTIKGSTRQESKEEKGDYYRCEISQGTFARTVALPGDVESGKARANFKDGILELVLPKKEAAKRRSVKVE